MQKIAVYPGTFDPITKGHESIVKRAIKIFDLIYVVIAINECKKPLFPLEKRLNWIKKVFENEKNIIVTTHTGLIVDFCTKVNAQFIIRGVRTSADFEYERTMAHANKLLNHNIDTILFLTPPELLPINSTIVREIIKNNGDVSKFIPDCINVYE